MTERDGWRPILCIQIWGTILGEATIRCHSWKARKLSFDKTPGYSGSSCFGAHCPKVDSAIFKISSQPRIKIGGGEKFVSIASPTSREGREGEEEEGRNSSSLLKTKSKGWPFAQPSDEGWGGRYQMVTVEKSHFCASGQSRGLKFDFHLAPGEARNGVEISSAQKGSRPVDFYAREKTVLC